MQYLIGVHAVILDDLNRIFVIKRTNSNDHMPLMWDLPGGTVEFGETLEAALNREILEELSTEIEILYPVFTHSSFDSNAELYVVQIIFLCKFKTVSKIEVKLNTLEHKEYRWVNKFELDALPKIDFLDEFQKKQFGLMDFANN